MVGECAATHSTDSQVRRHRSRLLLTSGLCTLRPTAPLHIPGYRTRPQKPTAEILWRAGRQGHVLVHHHRRQHPLSHQWLSDSASCRVAAGASRCVSPSTYTQLHLPALLLMRSSTCSSTCAPLAAGAAPPHGHMPAGIPAIFTPTRYLPPCFTKAPLNLVRRSWRPRRCMGTTTGNTSNRPSQATLRLCARGECC